MVIGNGPDKRFSQKQIYVGIYTRKGIKDQIMCGFGNNCEFDFNMDNQYSKQRKHVKIVGKKEKLIMF